MEGQGAGPPWSLQPPLPLGAPDRLRRRIGRGAVEINLERGLAMTCFCLIACIAPPKLALNGARVVSMGDRRTYFAADFNAGRNASRRALATWQKAVGYTTPPPSFATTNRGKPSAGARR